MNELFRNLGISTNYPNSSNTNEYSSSSSYNPFIGTTVQIKNNLVKLDELIAEGGFGYVFKCKDQNSSKIYAVKRMISSDEESKQEIENEISMLERIQFHRNIMEFYGFEIVLPNVYYLLCEYCGGGSLKNFSLPLQNRQLLNKIIYQITLALEKLHHFGIIHRDIKIENILFSNDGFVKICDFGSATDKSFKPDHQWNPLQRSLLEDEMNRHTTPMYRPPEILDTYLHYEINTSMDIWALGCLIYFLRFGQHPFEDSSKLRIINCNYTLPADVNHSDTLIEILKNCLQVNPVDRIDSTTIIKKMEDNYVDLNSPCVQPLKNARISPILTPVNNQPSNNVIMNSKSNPAINSTTSTTINNNNNYYNNTTAINIFQNASNVPGIAQSYFSGFTRYIKDTSKNVLQTVQNSIARQDLDLTIFTSRLIIMSYPAEGLESAYRNHIDDVRAVLESRNYSHLVINISGRSYDSLSKFGPKFKVIDGGQYWKDPKRVAPLQIIISLCDTIFKWLNQDNRNAVVIHCMDGRNNSAMLTISFLLLIGFFRDYQKALEFYIKQRDQMLDLQPSHYRYLNYIKKLKVDQCFSFFSNKKSYILKSIKMIGIPLFSKLRDGCRPFVEIFTDTNNKIYSSFTEYDRLIHYNKDLYEVIVWNDIDKTFDLTSDLCIIISHARSTIGSKMLNQTATALRMTSFQMNMFFEIGNSKNNDDNNNNNDNDDDDDDNNNRKSNKIVFGLNDLDDIDEMDRFPADFQIEINFEMSDDVQEQQEQEFLSPNNNNNNTNEYKSPINENEIILINKPDCLFLNNREFEEYVEIYNLKIPSEPYKSRDLTTEESQRLFGGKSKAKKEKKNKEKSQKVDEAMAAFVETTGVPDYVEVSRRANLIPADQVSMYEVPNAHANKLLDIEASPIRSNSISNVPCTSTSTSSALDDMRTLAPPVFADTSILQPLVLYGLPPLMPTTSTNPFVVPDAPVPQVVPPMPLEDPLDIFRTDDWQIRKVPSKPKEEDITKSLMDDIRVTVPKMHGNEFEDLLGGFKPTKKSFNDKTPPKSIAEIRRETLLKSGADPVMLKINDWTENKEKNIRALLCSLHEVIWEDCNWEPIKMHQLLTPFDVKKMYRKACLTIHPDKLVDTPHEDIARAIFVELNDAWNAFEKENKEKFVPSPVTPNRSKWCKF